ncbi:MAG TPA: histidine kinase dimerization/phospho-acceptor domain-containing protein, partial [Polyangia bacterium]
MTVKELQHLAAAMAHEVRNPLNSMAIHVELLEGRMRKEGAGADVMKSLSVLASEIDRVDKILEQYLGYAGPTESARVPVQARVLLGTVVERVRAEAAQRGVGVELKDGGGGDARWAVDGDALTEAIVAVVENAVAASAKGSVVSIAAHTDEASEQAEVIIVDGAAPIPAGETAKAFHIGSPRSRGTVGLTVAKQIVKGHGGS